MTILRFVVKAQTVLLFLVIIATLSMRVQAQTNPDPTQHPSTEPTKCSDKVKTGDDKDWSGGSPDVSLDPVAKKLEELLKKIGIKADVDASVKLTWTGKQGKRCCDDSSQSADPVDWHDISGKGSGTISASVDSSVVKAGVDLSGSLKLTWKGHDAVAAEASGKANLASVTGTLQVDIKAHQVKTEGCKDCTTLSGNAALVGDLTAGPTLQGDVKLKVGGFKIADISAVANGTVTIKAPLTASVDGIAVGKACDQAKESAKGCFGPLTLTSDLKVSATIDGESIASLDWKPDQPLKVAEQHCEPKS